MQPEFWHERWRTGQIGFHQPAADPHLIEHWPTLGVAAGRGVFVPLCGKSLDVLWLREQGHRVTGVELSAVAVECFCMEHGIPAKRRRQDSFDCFEAGQLNLLCGDFFSLTPKLIGPIAAAYDRAALISWAPELRVPYVDQMSSLMPSGSQTLLIVMEYPQAQMAGPPFSLTAREVERLYAARYGIQELSRHNILATEARLRARGLTELYEVCYRLTRS